MATLGGYLIDKLKIYIASPLSEQTLVSKVARALTDGLRDDTDKVFSRVSSATVLTSEQLTKWKTWNDCGWINDNWMEI